MLRGVKPEKVEKRLKVLFYGDAGVGKTTAAISFPKPYVIDTEKGATNKSYVDILEKNEGVIFQTSDFNEILTEIKTLLTIDHPYKTLVIDPMTNVYDDLIEQCTAYCKQKSKEKDADGTEWGRNVGLAKKKMKHMCNLLLRLDMNVIITTHSKVKYEDGAKAGTTYDCFDKLHYIFDFAFEIQKRGKERVALVKKTREDSQFKEDSTFKFSYENIAEMYGRELLEKDAVAEVLASEEQVLEIKRLVDLLKIEDKTIQLWLKKAESDTFEEMNGKIIQKCIDKLQLKISN